MSSEHPSATDATLPRIAVPPSVPVTPDEIERRRSVVARIRALREEIGPIGTRADELVHQVRVEVDGLDE